VHQRKSASDISIVWQVIYLVGLSSLVTYALHFHLWPVAYPGIVELTLIAYLTILKLWYALPTLRAPLAHPCSRERCSLVPVKV
jgi:hypothetical protein